MCRESTKGRGSQCNEVKAFILSVTVGSFPLYSFPAIRALSVSTHFRKVYVMALFGRLALVTGGASGIGKCTCQALALEGASIVVADINLERAIQAAKNLPGE